MNRNMLQPRLISPTALPPPPLGPLEESPTDSATIDKGVAPSPTRTIMPSLDARRLKDQHSSPRVALEDNDLSLDE